MNKSIIEIRPIWSMDQAPSAIESAHQSLLQLEKDIRETLQTYFSVVEKFELTEKSNGDMIKPLMNSALVDLVAGCEMARSGYVKQAFTLWRSWYEQAIFALYFMEAPLHREAWKISEEVNVNDSPNYRLMLHQLLNESGEKHAFSLIYTDRYLKLINIFQASKPHKDLEPIKRAAKSLTQLSQGVHGTFRPKITKSFEEACDELGKQSTPALKNAWSVVSQLWLLFFFGSIDLSAENWTKMRNGAIEKEHLNEMEDEQRECLLLLNKPFKNAFESLKHG